MASHETTLAFGLLAVVSQSSIACAVSEGEKSECRLPGAQSSTRSTMPPAASARALPTAKSAKGIKPPASQRAATAGASSTRGGTSRGQERGAATKAVLAGKKSGSTLDSVAEGAPAAADADSSSDNKPKGRAMRPPPGTLKAITTGATGVVEFLDDSNEPPIAKPDATSNPAESSSAEAPKQRWNVEKWLEDVDNLEGCIGTALITDEEGEQLADEEALAYVRQCDSKEVLIERLQTNGAIRRIANAIWPKLEILRAGPGTASELANNWKNEGAGDLLCAQAPLIKPPLRARALLSLWLLAAPCWLVLRAAAAACCRCSCVLS